LVASGFGRTYQAKLAGQGQTNSVCPSPSGGRPADVIAGFLLALLHGVFRQQPLRQPLSWGERAGRYTLLVYIYLYQRNSLCHRGRGSEQRSVCKVVSWLALHATRRDRHAREGSSCAFFLVEENCASRVTSVFMTSKANNAGKTAKAWIKHVLSFKQLGWRPGKVGEA
jgi:hypothetical protein